MADISRFAGNDAMLKKTILVFWALTPVLYAGAQTCTVNGQTPPSAILVCGSSSLSVSTPSFCGQSTVPVPCGDGYPYTNKNPNFFRMVCYRSGTLGFSIMPEDLTANYSWQLFDITATNPSDIFTNPSLFVACNWSGDVGEKGASSDGTNLTVCSGAQPLFSKMPDLVIGHTYLLMVCNESGTTGNYQLTFDGGSASITDAVEPQLLSARANCDGTRVFVRLNKAMKCNSISVDGSEFTISGGASVISAAPGICTQPFGTDSVALTLNQTLPYGNYTLVIHNGSDGNTITDVCGRNIPELDSLPFTLSTPQPTPMDSIRPASCAPGYIDLVFKKPIQCASVAADGSDFIITGPQPVSAVFQPGSCPNGVTTPVIRLQLSPATISSGTYQIVLASGNDGNTLIDECGLESPAGATLSIELFEPVSAQYTFTATLSCRETPVSFFHDGNHHTDHWAWDFGGNAVSGEQNPVYTFSKPGNHTVKLTVSNGHCTDTYSQTITTSGFLTAAFSAPREVCPGDSLHFENTSSGLIDTWRWSFGNGVSSAEKTPVGYRYSDIGREAYYTVTLHALNTQLNCGDSARRVIRVLSHCRIAVPTAFTPNGDGLNDFLYPVNALKADNLLFRVYNRMGQLVFETRDWSRKWDGTLRGQPMGTGIYAWLLSYVQRDSGEHVFMKGTTLLLR